MMLVGIGLLVGACSSPRIQTAGDTGEKYWGWCDRVQQGRPTVLCFQQ